jgi:hypothetical protein
MNSINNKYHNFLAKYFTSQPFYLDEKNNLNIKTPTGLADTVGFVSTLNPSVFFKSDGV